MEYFPEESVKRAREIAQLYKDRWTTKKNIVGCLYDHKFIEAPYGFEDSIRTGRGGHYLHQLKRDADCFSLAGMQYIVARELGLKPKLYWATDMKDVQMGENPIDKMVCNHAFITVTGYGSKEMVFDPSMNRLGEVKFEDGKLLIHEKSSEHPDQTCERLFSTLTNWSEQDYVAEMEKHQSQGGAKLALAAGQTVDIGRHRIVVQYFPRSNSLTASAFFGISPPILEDSVSCYCGFELQAPMLDDGSWAVEEGTISFYDYQGRGWTKEQCSLIHNEFKIPYRTAEAYVANLQKANNHFGVKSPIHKLNIYNNVIYFMGKGFSSTGEVTMDNGVDPEGHKRLLEEIVNAAPIHSEPKEARDDINRYAAFFAAQQRMVSEANPYGMIYSQEQHEGFIDEMLGVMVQDYSDKVDDMMHAALARAGLQDGIRRIERNMVCRMNMETVSDRFRHSLVRRKDSIAEFEEDIDFALYQRDHPLGSVKVSEDELVEYYQASGHKSMINLAWVLPSLKLKQFQAGLKKILAK